MEMDKKKSGRGLALLASIGRSKPKSDKSGGMMDDKEPKDSEPSFGESMDGGADSESMSPADMAADDLAESMGLPEDKRADFASSFKAAVKACVDSGSGDEGSPSPFES